MKFILNSNERREMEQSEQSEFKQSKKLKMRLFRYSLPHTGEGGIFLTSKKALHGYLDRLRENLEVLDSAIDDTKAMPKKGAEGRARLKAIRDLVELRNATLLNIKVHLLGRNETGAPYEPEDLWNDNPEIMFERWFNSQMAPWTREDLKLTCKDCGKESEEIIARSDCSHVDLCDVCYEKRQTEDSKKEQSLPSENETIPSITESLSSMATTIRSLPPDQQQQWIRKLKVVGVSDELIKKLVIEDSVSST